MKKILVLLCFLCFALILNAVFQMRDNQDLKNEIEQLRSDVRRLELVEKDYRKAEETIASLKNKIQQLKTEAQAWPNQLTSIGFYAIIAGNARKLVFLEADDSLKKASDGQLELFVELRKGDFLSLFGDMIEGTLGSSIRICEFDMENKRLVNVSGEDNFFIVPEALPIEKFFHLEPEAPVYGRSLLKLVPKENIANGYYFLVKQVRFLGDVEVIGFCLNR